MEKITRKEIGKETYMGSRLLAVACLSLLQCAHFVFHCSEVSKYLWLRIKSVACHWINVTLQQARSG